MQACEPKLARAWSEMPAAWRTMAFVGLGISTYLHMSRQRERHDYEKMHREVFGIGPLPSTPWRQRPVEWIKRELFFGWVDLLAAEVNAAVYFTFYPERRERWHYLYKKYGFQPTRSFTLADARKLSLADARKLILEVSRRLQLACSVLRSA